MKKLVIITLACFIKSVTWVSARTMANDVKQWQDTLKIGYGQSVKKTHNAFSIAGIGSDAFEYIGSIDVASAFYGRIAGLNVYQGVGSSADNVASFSFHGHAPLVLLDGFPANLSDVRPMEIESCYLLKDAASAALYGIRGGNGVLVINTKRGRASKPQIKVEYDWGVNTQFRNPEFADAYTYANCLNSALVSDGLSPRYSLNELNAFRDGTHPYDYPNVDWWEQTLGKTGFTHDLKLSFSGGSDRFRYFVALGYYRDLSMLKENAQDSRYSTKPTDTRLYLRANADVKVTPTTMLYVGLSGKLGETNGTRYGRTAIFNPIFNTPAAVFPVRYENGIYGGNSTYNAANPVALLTDYGHVRNLTSTLIANMRLNQNLDAITKGLSAEVAFAIDNSGGMEESSSKEYRYMNSYPSLTNGGTLITSPVIYGKDSETLGHNQPFRNLLVRSNFQGRISYNRFLGKHFLESSVIMDMQSNTLNGRNTSRSNLSYIFNVGYSYNQCYFLNAVLNYSGTSYLPDNDKFRTYPAVSATWNIANEGFMQNVKLINQLRLKASYGLSGWDGNLTHELWRQGYGASNTSYNFGVNAAPVYGNSEGRLPVIGLTAEKSERGTLGLELTAFDNRFGLSVEGFYEKRSDILLSASNNISQVIGIEVGSLCEGEYEYKGFDVALNWKDKIGKVDYRVGANVSYLDTKILKDNQAYQEYDYLYTKGNRINQMYGLEAVGFFNSQLEINNSPVQTFGKVAPGDVKYKDQNGDNRIDEKDVVKMCASTLPRFYFGFDLMLNYKQFELAANFQGLTGKTVDLLNSPLYKPLVNNGNISDTFLKREVCWSEENKAIATMPRLTTQPNPNNYRASSLWYRDGSFLKLRSLVISYTIPKKIAHLADIKVYVQGNNLFSLDNLHFADPEQLGIAYPSVTTYWAGLKLNF